MNNKIMITLAFSLPLVVAQDCNSGDTHTQFAPRSEN
jgi:hypothetical protein